MQKAFTFLFAVLFFNCCSYANSQTEQMHNEKSTQKLSALLASQASDNLLWQGYTRGFRQQHNFGFFLGHAQSKWQIEPYDRSYHLSPSHQGIYFKSDYSFHIPIWQGFGYFLGSSAGFLLQDSSRKDSFAAATSIHFPGARLGVVWNISPVWRLSTGMDIYMERLNQLSWEKDRQKTALSLTMISQDIMIMLEMFYKLNSGVRLLLQKRSAIYQSPASHSKGKVVDSKIARQDFWLGIGIIYHLL